MGNVFKSVANFLDKAISGKEVDVIVLEEKPLDASVAGDLVAGEAGGLVTGVLVTGAEAPQPPVGELGAVAGDGEGTDVDSEGCDAAGEGADAGEGEEADENADEKASEAAGGEDAGASNGEPQGIAAVQQMLGEGEVAIGAAELEQLRADAGEWVANKAELTQLRAWKANGSKPNVMNGAVDAADAVSTPPKKVSAATQKAIDLKNKMAGG
ncbi:MAG TPA: hypothetical protein VK175_06220 [Leadbetterella sp.]|nr:hypothetical protein [Leadbetterella sp.]